MTTATAMPNHGPAASSSSASTRAPFPSRYLAVELRRRLLNRRNVLFSLVMPIALYFAFASSQEFKDTWIGHANVSAAIMVSMALYGAIVTATSAGASVSVEIAQGWARTLNLTPLRPVHYVCIKVLTALAAAAVPVLVVTALGAVSGARIEGAAWVVAPLLAWLGSALFAAFGLFLGLLLPSENVMQYLGIALTVLAFAGGLFVPLSGTMLAVARFTPMYGVGEIARGPLTDQAEWLPAILNVVVWGAIFSVGAARRYARATGRV